MYTLSPFVLISIDYGHHGILFILSVGALYFCIHLPSLSYAPLRTHTSQPLVTVILLSVCMKSIVFNTYLPHMSENIRDWSFWAWLISLNIMFSSSIRVLSKSRTSFFLWVYNNPLCVCVTISSCIHLLMDTSVDSKSCAVIKCIYLFSIPNPHLLDRYPAEGLLSVW